MEKLMQIVQASSSKFDEANLASYLEKDPIWEFAGISRQGEKTDLLLRYYDAMEARNEIKFCFLFHFLRKRDCFFLSCGK